jgi:hypothetical protein
LFFFLAVLGESKLIIHTAKPSDHSADTLVFETMKNHTGNETFVTDAPYFYFEIRTNWGTVKEFHVEYLSYNEPVSGNLKPINIFFAPMGGSRGVVCNGEPPMGGSRGVVM